MTWKYTLTFWFYRVKVFWWSLGYTERESLFRPSVFEVNALQIFTSELQKVEGNGGTVSCD